ncbi:MAG TPA: PQQ-dependent dehydrogenase, methanol/ethanol family [Steroidobacteraceae bacterium]|nr:PQQ-dependent dehydrogenase, methanol/ethanol family [Steroidobacteraceae bacterium]
MAEVSAADRAYRIGRTIIVSLLCVASQPSQKISGAADIARAAQAEREVDQWRLNGRDIGGTYFSPLTDVNRADVRHLGFAWAYALATQRGLEATPLVIDGVMYAAGNFGRVYSLDAATGKMLWTYDPQIDGRWARYACCDAVNRGLAAWRGRIYVGSLDGYLHAIDAATGKRIWKVDTLIGRAQRLPYTITGAPLIAGRVVVIGNAGSDFQGVRGYVSAYDLDSGALKWRFFTVPRDPRLGPQDQPQLRKAVATWGAHYRWKFAAGANVWDGMAYDPDLKLLYVGTGNVSPYGRQGGDDLYADCIIAIHADTGAMAWYYQVVPGDEWDYDSTQKLILTEITVGGKQRKVLIQASKDGFIYVLDRATGELISASPFAYYNWTKGLDLKTGRPIPNPHADYADKPRLIFPSMAGAHSWQPMSYSPETGLVYIPAQEAPMVYVNTARRPAGLIEGNFTVAGLFPEDYDPASLEALFGQLPPMAALAQYAEGGVPRSIGVLKAWDPVRRKLVWQRPLATFWNGGVLSTAGGLVFQGDAAGFLNAYDAQTGKRLAHIEIGTSIMAAPMTYRAGGAQFIAFMAGYGGGTGLFSPFPEGTAAYKYGNQGRIVALRLGGPAIPKPAVTIHQPWQRPPAREGTPARIARGAILYNRFCGRCHVFGRGELPDLRRFVAGRGPIFDRIVLGAVLASQGMGGFDDVLSKEDVAEIHAFLVDRSWDAYTHQQESRRDAKITDRP